MKEKKRNSKCRKYYQRNQEQPVYSLFIEISDQASDAIVLIIFFVSVIENNADGINEEKAAGCEQQVLHLK